jgi:hypothetical protein
LLCVVVGERDAEVVEEGRHPFLVTLHAVQEVDGLGLLGATGASNEGGRWRPWMRVMYVILQMVTGRRGAESSRKQ